MKRLAIMVAMALAPLLVIGILMTNGGGPAAANSNQQSCVQPPGGLVNWWPGDGNAVDIWGGNDGTLVGDTSFAAGVAGDAFSFDGDEDYVEIPHDSSFNLAEFSVDAWVYIDPAQNNGEVNVLVSKSSFAAADGGFVLTHDDRGGADRKTNALRFIVFEGGAGTLSEAFLKDAFPSAGFYHVAGTFDGSVTRLYLDGVLKDTGSPIAGIGFNTRSVRIGASHVLEASSIDDRFTGLIDEVEIYNNALAASDIAGIHSAGSEGKCEAAAVAHNIENLIADVNGLGLPEAVATSLTASLNGAPAILNDGNPHNDVAACGKLTAFINDVDAQEQNGQLTATQAEELREAAEGMKAVLGCRR
ncbi:MAG: LamG domain-containing protein [Chloroflexi bacterium]|nr:LamG domain-containing protein [Chloroflexota bacterium]